MSYSNDTIVKELDDISNAITSSESTTAKLINSEVHRLKSRQAEILDAKFGQNRVIDLNRSRMKQITAYTKVGIVTVISLGIILIFRLFGDKIPEAISSVVYVLLISACVFYGLIVYTDVNGREPTNFDRYNIPAPTTDLSEDAKNKKIAAAIKSGNLLAANADNKICSGQGCCDYDQAYSSSLNKCENCPANQYYIESKKQCGACSGTDKYLRITKSCGTCESGKNYITADQSCKTA